MTDANHIDNAMGSSQAGTADGTSADVVLINQLFEWLHEAEAAPSESNWRTEASESYDFYAGKQDSSEVLEKLAEQKRPALVYNTILPKINMLCGLAAQGNRTPYLFPVGTEDQALTDIMNGAYKHYRLKTRSKRVENECFEHTVKAGRSFMHYWIGGENPFKPEIKCKRIPGRDVFLDPLSKEYDLSDARYIFVDKWFSKEDLKALFPGIETSTVSQSPSSGTEVPSFYDAVTDKYRVTECWYRKYSKVVWFVNPLTGKVENASPVQFRRFKQALAQGIPNQEGQVIPFEGEIKAVMRMSKKIFYAIFSGSQIIEQGESPYKSKNFPYILFGAYKDEDENKWFSVIEMMKDPQKGRNQMRRQLLHMLNTSPKGILIHEVGAIANEDEYDARSSEPNYRLVVNPNALEKVKFSQQPQINPIYSQLDSTFEQDIKDTSGVQDSLLGIQTSSREPGITVRMRQETGIAVLHVLFENFRDSRLQAARFLVDMIQQYMTQEEMIRIEGQEGVQLMQVNTQTNPQMPGFNDITAGEYDFVMDEAVENTTMRMAIAQMLTEFAQNNPGSIPPQLIMEYSDLPVSARNQVAAYQQEQQQAQAQAEEAAFEREKELLLIKEGMDLDKTKMKVDADIEKSKNKETARPTKTKA